MHRFYWVIDNVLAGCSRPGAGRDGDIDRDLAALRALERRDLRDQNAGIAGDAAAELRRDLRERERPGHVIWRAVWRPAP